MFGGGNQFGLAGFIGGIFFAILGPSGSSLLLEDTGYLLLEDGSFLLLES